MNKLAIITLTIFSFLSFTPPATADSLVWNVYCDVGANKIYFKQKAGFWSGSKVTVFVDDWKVVNNQSYFSDASISVGLYNFTLKTGQKILIFREKGGEGSTTC